MLPLLAVGLGQSLLPDLTCGLLIELGKEQIEHLRVPADGVTLDTLLDVLSKTRQSMFNQPGVTRSDDLPQAAQASQSCCLKGR